MLTALVLVALLPLCPASRVYTADYSMYLHTIPVSRASWALGRREPTREASAVACATRCQEPTLHYSFLMSRKSSCFAAA